MRLNRVSPDLAAFEVEILRDLTQAGITYQAHDLRNRQSRLSAYDLRVLGLYGDINQYLRQNEGEKELSSKIGFQLSHWKSSKQESSRWILSRY